MTERKMSRIEKLEQELQKAIQSRAAIPGQMAKIATRLEELRARRTELLTPAALGDAKAADELRSTEQAILDALRDERRLKDTGYELHVHCNKLQTSILRGIVTEELEKLPQLEKVLNGAMQTISKTISSLDFSTVDATTQHLIGPGLSIFQNAGTKIRNKVGEALTSALAWMIANPNKSTSVDCRAIETWYRQTLAACDEDDAYQAKKLSKSRMDRSISRRDAEARTAL
jgi:hypothetical protein